MSVQLQLVAAARWESVRYVILLRDTATRAKHAMVKNVESKEEQEILLSDLAEVMRARLQGYVGVVARLLAHICMQIHVHSLKKSQKNLVFSLHNASARVAASTRGPKSAAARRRTTAASAPTAKPLRPLPARAE